MDNPPYSPDLAPSDFWLFDYKRLDAQMTEILSQIPKDEWIKTFDKLLERIQLCIQIKEAYFEQN